MAQTFVWAPGLRFPSAPVATVLLPEEFTSSPFRGLWAQNHTAWDSAHIFVCIALANAWVLPCLLFIKLLKPSKSVWFCEQRCPL